MQPIPFASQSYQNRSLPASAQRCFNLYPEALTEGKNSVVLHGTPGLKVFSSGVTGPVRGMNVMGGELFAVIGVNLYKIGSDGSQTLVNSLHPIQGGGRVSMANNGTELAIVNGAQGYVYQSGVTEITDPDFPEANTVSFINQRMLYDSQFGFTYSDLDDAGTMGGTVNGTGDPDQAKAILVDHLEVWMFGDKSTEVWYNSGAAISPFERLSGAFIEKGCAAQFSPAKMDNTVYWIGDDFAVYRADGYVPVRVSTPTVEKEFQSYNVASAFSFTYTEEGHTFYQVTFPRDNKTWVFDASTQRWHERGNMSAGRHRANCYAYAHDRHLVGDFENGIIYEMDLDTYTDNGEEIQRIAVSPPIHNNGEEVFQSRLWIDFEPGTGLTTGQGSDPQAMLDHSDDGGRTWSNERWTTIGKIGKYAHKAIWRRCGTYFSRVFRVTVSDPVKVVIIAAFGDF